MSPAAGRVRQIGNSPVHIGRFTYGTEHITVRQWGEGAALRIGSFCSISSAVTIFLGGNHRADWITTFPFGHIFREELGGTEIVGHPATNGDVVIGHDVWIGHGVTIMSGVTIGSGAIIAANSTVIKDVEPYCIVGGNPARPIKLRFSGEIIALLLHLRWWDLPIETIRAIAQEISAPPAVERVEALIAKYRS